MKFRIILTALVCMVFAVSTSSAGTGFNLNTKGIKTITLNNKVGSNQAQFSSKAPLENIDGGTATVTGSFTLDLGNLEATTGKVLVAVNTMQTGIALRDRHLQEKDWLDAESNPNITFDIKKLSSVQIVSSGGGKGVAKANAEGVFTLHGVGKAMTISIEITYMEKAPNDLVMIKVNDFPVSLKEHGVTGRKGIIGSKVSEIITIKATLYGSAN
ncbi:MAG: YceI family protein [Candidatus Kapabacteria bacterium]|nr:YceI family protein [Candidatus Kapabacteria bacterium]